MSEYFQARLRRLVRWNQWTLVVVLLLILAGGIVRSSGSGMGCPDWPLCFGQVIPPLLESDLPANYQEIYAERGYKDTRFNALKTWTEYLNRLLGAVTGLMVLVQAVLAFLLYRSRSISMPASASSGVPTVGSLYIAGVSGRTALLAALLALLLVLVQGGIGAWVVASHLQGSVVTLHLALAWVLMGVQVGLGVHLSGRPTQAWPIPRAEAWAMGVWLLSLLVQLFLGAGVREAVDAWTPVYATDVFGLKVLGAVYLAHKNLWMLIMLGGAWLAYRLWTHCTDGQARFWSLLAMVSLTLQVISGLWMVLGALPALPRTLHVLLGSLALVGALGWAFRVLALQRATPS
ncbi:MAG: COX15/CtaA family protein [Bacteroidota bacterium]